MKNRLYCFIFCTILSFSFLFQLLPTVYSFTNIWNGSYSSGFASGTGTQIDPFVIETAEQLAFFAKSVNNGNTYDGKHVHLSSNILLNESSDWESWNVETAPSNVWTPIGTEAFPFRGTFDGGNHSIDGIYINSQSNYQGLFGFCYNCTIKDLAISSGFICGSKYTSSLAGCLYKSEVLNCNTGVTVLGREDYSAGIVGYAEQSWLNNCHNTGSVGGTQNYAGGIVAAAVDTCTINNCVNTGSIGGTQNYTGGIAGYSSDSTTISHCENSGDVTVDGRYVAGIVGYSTGCNIIGCENTGNITGNSPIKPLASYPAGGVVSFTISTTITDCRNTGSVYGNEAGGIAAIAENSEISQCQNTGVITGYKEAAGGIIGCLYHATVEKCSNHGIVTCIYPNYIGGVVGNVKSESTIRNCYNSGTITGPDSSAGGGVIGYLQYSTIYDCCNIGNIVCMQGGAGGVVCGSDQSNIQFCYNKGTIEATYGAGGVFNSANMSVVTNCFNDGSVSSNENDAGGIGGSIWKKCEIINCYNAGKVNSCRVVGGIIGESNNYSSNKCCTISCCYNVGVISGETEVGGILGRDDEYIQSTISFCYYLETCIQNNNVFGIMRTDEQMQAQSYYTGFDFNSVWTMTGDSRYPYPELIGMYHGSYPNPFVDVQEGKYYYTPVLWAYYHDPQITGGTDATHFSPKNTCTREQIVTFLWKAAGAPEPETTESPFSDVKPGKYYFKPILWAVENGITGGVGGGKFGVKQGCTREQCVTFLWKAAGAPEPETTESPFSDVKPGKYYFKPILWAVENGITGGVGDGKFGVGQTCTRGQIVTFLYKYMVG